MCLGENNAQQTITYLNAQLQALWNVSCECAQLHGNDLKPDSIRREYENLHKLKILTFASQAIPSH